MESFFRYVTYIDLYENNNKQYTVGFIKWRFQDKKHDIEIQVKDLAVKTKTIPVIIEGKSISLGKLEISQGIGRYKETFWQGKTEEFISVNQENIHLSEINGLKVPLEDNACLYGKIELPVERCDMTEGRHIFAENDVPSLREDAAGCRDSKFEAAEENILFNGIEEKYHKGNASKSMEGIGEYTGYKQNAEYSRDTQESKRKAEYSRNTEEGRRSAEYSRNTEESRRTSEYSGNVEEGRRKAEYSGNVEEGRRKAEYSRNTEEDRRKAEYSGNLEEGRRNTEYSRNLEEDRRSIANKPALQENKKPEKIKIIEPMPEDKWNQLCKKYVIIHPFPNKRPFLSITPNDFVILQQGYQKLVHNSFLLHGFYNYGHIILGSLGDGEEVQYYIGVPGVYYEREKRAAQMFGFVGFEGVEKIVENGSYGYYMIEVKI